MHSHIDHLFAMIREADRAGVESVCVHPLLDGRDVGATTALEYVDALTDLLDGIDAGAGRRYRIASGGGRVSDMMQVQAAWLYLKNAGAADKAMAAVFSDS